MGRFMYVHFGDDVPRNIEKEYNKLLRKERYLEERDAENGLIYPNFDAVLAANPDPASIPISEEEEQEQEDPRAELVQQLLEYKMYKCMANELKDRQLDAGKVWYKKKDIPDEVLAYEEPVNLEELVGDIRLSDLNRIFQSIMKRQEEKIDKVRSKFGKIEKEEVSLEEKMDFLTDYAASHKHFSFRGMLTASSSKVEVIVTFLAILELMKTGKLTIVQEHIFDDIQIESRIAA